MTISFENKVIIMTGGSRGIGREIALAFAKLGAKVAICAKSAEESGKLKGTVFSVAKEIDEAGGEGLPIICDARDEAQLQAAISQTVDKWGQIDLLVNNAGSLGVAPLALTPTKKFDLMHALNTRAPLITMRECLPHLLKTRGTVLNLCPPINLDAGWLGAFIPYTSTKYSMTLLSMGFAEEVKKQGVTVKTLWPATIIATDAVTNLTGDHGLAISRKPSIMADAAVALLTQPELFSDGISWLDDQILARTGITDFAPYANDPSNVNNIQRDFYVGEFSLPKV